MALHLNFALPRTTHRGIRVAALAWAAWALPLPAPAEPVPIVIGQSLALGGADDGTGTRVAAGAVAYVEAVNAQGGIRGRPLKLITLTDDGTPAHHALNLRKLAREYRAVAFLSCVGDAVCRAAALVADELAIPLVGPIARAKRLTRWPSAYVFRVRAPFERETDVMARQLQSMGVSSVALLTESKPTDETVQTMISSMMRHGLRPNILQIRPGPKPSAVADALERMGRSVHQAAVLDLSVSTLDAIAGDNLDQRKEWPLVLVSPSSGALNAVMAVFHSRTVGFTAVVPDPEWLSLPLTIELQRNADRTAAGPWAITYAGMESYINTKICVEAIRRAGLRVEPAQVTAALSGLSGYDLGGLTVSFDLGRASASDRVHVGVRAINGSLAR